MSSPSKRRKTSPTTSVPINAPPTPSRIPVPRQDGSRGLPGRPSFASPTKASLSRHYPQLLNRPVTGGVEATEAGQDKAGKAFEDLSAKAQPEKLQVPKDDGVAAGRLVDTERAQPDSQAVQRVSNELRTANRGHASQLQAQEIHATQGGLPAKIKRKSRSPLKIPAKSVDGLPGKPAPVWTGEEIDPFGRRGLRRSPVASQATETPPEDPNPFKKSGLRRSPLPSRPSRPASQIAETPVSATPTAPIPPKILQVEEPVIQSSLQPPSKGKRASAGAWQELFPEPAAKPAPPTTTTQPEEAELPPTPTQRGIADPIVTTPPTGIHGVHAINETSSRRRKRKSTEGSKFTSSPLKPREGNVVEQVKQADTAQDASQKGQPQQKEPREQRQENGSGKQSDRRRSVPFLIPEDPHAAKKKLRDDLLQELQQLQADLILANAENERLRLHYESKNGDPPAAANHSELISLLRRTTEQPAKPTPKPQSIFDHIEMFLPFFSQIPKQIIEAQPEQPLPSHLPLEVDNPLPYLQAFTPLTYTSNIFNIVQPLSPDSSSASTTTPLIQRHLITARHPQGLFAARLLMDVDTSAFSISSISLLKLDPVASFELGTFLNHHIDNKTHLSKDISVLSWAMARWTEVSIRRARFWCAVETELGSAGARKETLRKINGKLAKRRRTQGLFVEDEAQDDDDELGGEYKAKSRKFARRQLLPHMGRTSMEISNANVDIRIEWKLAFDWAGDVESVFDADVRVPGTWTHSDDRNSLSKIPELFRNLVQQKGPMNATRSIVALLMAEEET